VLQAASSRNFVKLFCWAFLSLSIGCSYPNPCRISTEPPVFVILSLWPLAAWGYLVFFTGTDFLTGTESP
jgi:hypothetical protein